MCASVISSSLHLTAALSLCNQLTRLPLGTDTYTRRLGFCLRIHGLRSIDLEGTRLIDDAFHFIDAFARFDSEDHCVILHEAEVHCIHAVKQPF